MPDSEVIDTEIKQPELQGNQPQGEGEGAEASEQTAVTSIPDDIQKELERLRAFEKSIKEKEPEKTPEQLAREKELDNVNFRKFSVENGILKDEDFTKYESFKARQDRELVFESFEKEYKEDNPEADEDDVKTAFELQYHLDSANDSLKKRGEKLISKEAAELRSPLENSYNTAKTKYDEELLVAKNIKPYEDFMDSQINKAIQDKYDVFNGKSGENDVPISIELTTEEKQELFKAVSEELKTPETFYKFLHDTKDGKNEFIEKLLQKELKYAFNERFSNKIYSSIATTFEGVGVKKGSNIGAEAPFAVVKTMNNNSALSESADKQVQESHSNLSSKINFR